MKALKICGKVFSGIIMALLVLVIIFNVSNLVLRKTTNELQPRIFGYSSAVILSGSMEPTISVNDIVIYKEKETYEVGDIVIFANADRDDCTTHRIVGVAEEGFITKGDANNTEDMFRIRNEDIFGEVWLVIPYLGIISEYMTKPLGVAVVALVGFCIVVLPVILGGKKKEEEKGDSDIEAEIERLRKLTEDKED